MQSVKKFVARCLHLCQRAKLKSPPKNVKISPTIGVILESPNHSSRFGRKIDTIVLHHTDTETMAPVVSWFMNRTSKVSAHYVVDRDGTIASLVPEERCAWHCKGKNISSIGIEVVAKMMPMTRHQERAVLSLCRFLMAKYDLEPSAITTHQLAAKNPTLCPGLIFGSEGQPAFKKWVAKHF